MKKKIIICLVVLLLIIAIAVVCVVFFLRKDASLLKQFNHALKNEDSMDEFIENNIDFKTACAYELAYNYTEYPFYWQEINEQIKPENVEKIKNNLTEEKIENYKQEKMRQYEAYCSEEYEKFNRISEKEKYTKGTGLEVRKVSAKDESVYFNFYYYNDVLIDITIKKKSYYYDSEKDMYNAKIKPYIDEGVKGSKVKSLIDQVISMNQENAGVLGKFIGIKAKENSIKNYESYEELLNACRKASIYDFDDGSRIKNSTNSEENVIKATEEMTKLKAKINSQRSYNVKAWAYKENIVWIYIEGPDGEDK